MQPGRLSVLVCCAAAVLSCASSLARATAQQPDILLLDGAEYHVLTNPLEPFLELHPDKRPSQLMYVTSLWRGYVATWRVHDSALYLTKVEIRNLNGSWIPQWIRLWWSRLTGWVPQPSYRDVLEDLFPGRRDVGADWFSGYMIVPTGGETEYVHMGYGSTYASYLILRLDRGIVTEQWNLTEEEFRAFRDAQFETFSRTDKYRQSFDGMKRRGWGTDEEIRSFLFAFHS